MLIANAPVVPPELLELPPLLLLLLLEAPPLLLLEVPPLLLLLLETPPLLLLVEPPLLLLLVCPPLLLLLLETPPLLLLVEPPLLLLLVDPPLLLDTPPLLLPPTGLVEETVVLAPVHADNAPSNAQQTAGARNCLLWIAGIRMALGSFVMSPMHFYCHAAQWQSVPKTRRERAFLVGFVRVRRHVPHVTFPAPAGLPLQEPGEARGATSPLFLRIIFGARELTTARESAPLATINPVQNDPAASTAGPRLSEDQLSAFRRDGFLLVHGLTTPDEIMSLRSLYDRMFEQRRGWDKGDLFDMVGPDDLKRGLALPQMLWPSRYEPTLAQTKLAASAHSIAEQIFGPGVENVLEHAINKPPFNGAETPWHQDDSFAHKSSMITEQISIWMPLQDVTIQSGCMRYIRGSNLGPLYPHRSPNNDPRIHGLELCSPPDLTNCVVMPMPAGSAVIHHSRTIHGAGGNSTDQPRRAYVLGYGVKSGKRQTMTKDYPWNLEKQTAREQRELQSLSPLRRTLRKIKRFMRGQKF